MATNPMQRKSRISFLLGMLLMLIIAAIVIAMLYMKIQDQQKQLKNYIQTTSSIYILNTDVQSGQVLTPDMFTTKQVATSTIPANASTDITTTLASYSLSDKDGRPIYKRIDDKGNTYYYYMINNKEHPIYTGENTLATYLTTGDSAYFYAGDNNTERTTVTVSENAVVAKIDMKANTVITTSLISRGNEVTTDDVRKAEYNVIDLPVDLAPGEYVDIRFRLPTGEDYIVVSKKAVSIPEVDGVYSSDTIQMNLNESEIISLSGAIVENFKISGSKLYAVKYSEAGIQDAASVTYAPSTALINLINSDRNVVNSAIKGLQQRNNAIDSAVSANSEDASDNVKSKNEESQKSAKEQREKYLESLPATTTTTTTTTSSSTSN